MRRNTFDGTSSGSGSGGAAIDVPIAQSCRVEVLPGRQFPSFAAGDVGTVKRVDEEAFIQACLGQPIRNAADAEIGLKVVQTIDAMYRSAKSGLAETISMTVAS
ncbi:unnamed protein product [Polarella glacialis]|uniref:Uncharacterized protein n=1 Tax=Polarella glacialis TaxID=89957 RepID=A0A813EGH6_POLGL|nr:unnamed protein product [Polarella glacialis]